MNKEFIYIAFLLFFLLVISWLSDKQVMFKFLILIFIGVLISNVDKIRKLVEDEKK
jgi:UDP-N-acetylmuramyl pentapeptide phosphotransferase/UDP-N-acetylglucosamine-1-phosphate transferase